MKVTPWLILLSMSLASCSGSKSAQKIDEEIPQIELSDADEFIDGSETLADASQEPISEEAYMNDSEPVQDSQVAMGDMDSEAPVVAVADNEPVINYDQGEMKQYVVQKNETLMLIAFKLYGNYERWKDIANQNRDTLKGSTNLSAGMTLNYAAPAEEFVWNPQGSPYLIRTGDTLGGISQQVYVTSKKWKLIWNNNRPLIKDPNRIYAGFTIFYPESGREVASEF